LYGRVIAHAFLRIIKGFDERCDRLGVVNSQVPQGANHAAAKRLGGLFLEYLHQRGDGLACRRRSDLGEGASRSLADGQPVVGG